MEGDPHVIKLVFKDKDKSGVVEDTVVNCGFSYFSSVKAGGPGKYACPMHLLGGNVLAKCKTFHSTVGYLLRHLNGKDHPELPETWAAHFKADR
jgi:hypothetical protein